MNEKGIISCLLLKAFMEPYPDRGEDVIKLMIRYSLLVKMGPNHFIAPALLPARSLIENGFDDISPVWSSVNRFSRFVFVFASSPTAFSSSAVSLLYCSSHGFLPNGLFQRLIGKCLSWSNETLKSYPSIHNCVFYFTKTLWNCLLDHNNLGCCLYQSII